MQLSTKGRRALLAMIDLLQHSAHGPVALHTISRRQGISMSHLDNLFSGFRTHGLVVSMHGRGGGYLLARPAGQISAAEVVAAVSRPAVAIGCGGKGDCRGEGAGLCMAHDLWAGLNEYLFEYLRSVSLEDLAGTTAEPAPARHVTSRVPSYAAG